MTETIAKFRSELIKKRMNTDKATNQVFASSKIRDCFTALTATIITRGVILQPFERMKLIL